MILKIDKTVYFVFLLILGLSSFTQNKDSLEIESLFNELLRGQKDSVQVYSEVRRIERRLSEKQIINWVDYSEAKYLLFSGNPKRAGSIAIEAIQSLQTDASNRSLLKFYVLLGSSYSYLQDYQKGISYFKKGLEIAEEHKLDLQVAYLHNNIANVFFSLLDYSSAHKHAEQSIAILKNYPDDPNYASILAILGVSEAKLGNFFRAEELASKAKKIAGEKSNYLALTISIHAFGEVEFNKDNFASAQSFYLESLDLAERFQQSNFVLLNSIGLLSASIELKDFKNAVQYGERALGIASNVKNNSTLYSINRKLAIAYNGVGEDEKAFTCMKVAHDIYMETNKLETQQAINDLLIQYDTEKKEKEITAARLELLAKEVESSKLWNLITLTGVLLLVAIVTLVIYRAKTRERIYRIQSQKRKELYDALLRGEERERKRLGHELHDGLASQLVGLKYRLESDPTISENVKKDMVQQISNAHEETRRIAHNLAPSSLKEDGLLKALQQFAEENSSPQLLIEYSHIGEHNVEMSPNHELMLYRIVQELVQNAVKHAQSTEIFIQSSFVERKLTLQVENNGAGFDIEKNHYGNGLNYVTKRLKLLQGEFFIDSNSSSDGAVAFLSLYLNNKEEV